MEKLKLGEWGERIKIGGAQMSRKVSGKMKEILQVQTPEGKMVDEATSDRLEEPDWAINLRICSLLSSEEFSGQEVVKAIKKKIACKNQQSQRLSLELLEACAMNCDKVFSEIASEKILDEMVRVIDNPLTHFGTRQRALQLIQAWGESSDLGYLPVFQQTYMSLKARGATFPVHQDVGSAASFPPFMEPLVDQSPTSLPPGYPAAGITQGGGEQIPFVHGNGILSTEQKKEELEIARNSIELLSSMLGSESKEGPIKDNPIVSIVEKCRQSQASLKRIIESTSDDESLLFDALNLHDELQLVLSKYEESQAVKVEAVPVHCSRQSTENSALSTTVEQAEKPEQSEGTLQSNQ
ncbi:TOM1-like protein 2 [Nymphaea colorata]|nr:TOM1-like protein 2 [Nymphaea colorata]XP_031483485.1 TOM1-like protein 2 [Nymphaea colorata]XP_031483486.1 TOM1-like protein 2 [Nymphaea colorata]